MVVLACFVSSCGLADHGEAPNTRSKVSHATLAQDAETTVSLLLPAGGDVRNHGLVAAGSLELRDGSKATTSANAPLDLYNLGEPAGNTPQTTIGPWNSTVGAACNTLVSRSSVLLRDRARVAGDVTTAGTIQMQNPASVYVGGVKRPGAQIAPPVSLSWVQPLESDTAKPPLNVWSGNSLTLNPGSYGKVSVSSNASITLKSGIYALSEFYLESQSKLNLQLDESKGPVVLYVNAALT